MSTKNPRLALPDPGALLEAADPRERVVIGLALQTGCRLSEVGALPWTHALRHTYCSRLARALPTDVNHEEVSS